jgi:hypothetical protein
MILFYWKKSLLELDSFSFCFKRGSSVRSEHNYRKLIEYRLQHIVAQRIHEYADIEYHFKATKVVNGRKREGYNVIMQALYIKQA